MTEKIMTRRASTSKGPGRTVARMLVILSLAATMVLPLAGVAHAACHAFTVEADPSTAGEGQTVTVTIRRDADVQPSSVRVRTVEVTATGGSDYTPMDERVEFTEGTEQTRQIDILDDDATEDSETFEIELSEGQGCEVNQNFSYDSATVTVEDDDAAAAEEPPAAQEPAAEEPAAQEPAAEDQTPAEETSDAGTADELPETGTDGSLVVLGLLGLAVGGGLVRRVGGARG